MKILKTLFLSLILLIFLFVTLSFSANMVTLTWDLNTEPDLAGYRIYKSKISNNYNFIDANQRIDISSPNVNIFTFDDVESMTYFVVTAYDLSNNESETSNEVLFIADSNIPDSLTINLEVLKPGYIKITWNKINDDIKGYRLYKSNISNSYNFGNSDSYLDISSETNFIYISELPKNPATYFVMTCYDLSNNESNSSNEIIYTQDVNKPGSPKINIRVNIY